MTSTPDSCPVPIIVDPPGKELPGGIRLERLTNAGAQAEGLPMGAGYIRIIVSDNKTEQHAIMNVGRARQIADAIVKLCRMPSR